MHDERSRKRPALDIEEEPEEQRMDAACTELKTLVHRWVLNTTNPDGTPGPRITYRQLVSVLYPSALEWLKRQQQAPLRPKPAAQAVISLDDQLEWQASMRSHSPKTPTPPMILKQLRETPPPSPKDEVSPLITNIQPEELAHKFRACISAGSLPRLSGDLLIFPDGINVLRTASTGVPGTEGRALDAGSLWLIAACPNTYSTDIASAVVQLRSLTIVEESVRKNVKAFLFEESTCADPEENLSERKKEMAAFQTRKEALEEKVKELTAKIARLERLEKKKNVGVRVQELISRTRAGNAETTPPTTAPAPSVARSDAEQVQRPLIPTISLALAEETELAVEWLRLGFARRDLLERKQALERRSKRFNAEMEHIKEVFRTNSEAVVTSL